MAALLVLLGLVYAVLLSNIGALSATKPDSVALQHYGEVLLARRDYPGAISALTKSSQQDGQNSRTYYLRARCYAKLSNSEKALADLDQAIRIDPANADALEMRGIIYDDQSQPVKAIADLTEAIRIRPLAITYELRGLALQSKGDRVHALADFSEAIRIDPLDVGIGSLCARGELYYQMSDFDRAIADYTEALRIQPGSVEAHRGLEAAHRAKANTPTTDAKRFATIEKD